jgi:protein SCO1/2
LIVTIILVLVFGCREDLEIINDIKYSDYQLLDIDSNNVVFPKILNGKIGIVGYIFTNCPDICPLTTNNMRLAQEKLIEHNIADIEFVSISFDPEVDKPSVLKSFANIRNLDLKNWNFLTGEKVIIDKLMKKIGVVAFVNDSTQFENGLKTYFYVHTDRIQLIDKDGRIRKNYLGSKLNIDELVADVKKLL